MNVRCALMDDLEEIIELYDAVSDAMKESAFDIGWPKKSLSIKRNDSIRYQTTNFIYLTKRRKDYRGNGIKS